MTANGMGSSGHRELLEKHVNSGDITKDEKKQMSAGNAGRLNPTWVEWLMGFPLGWTDLED
jgi:DNA (cytosine-5)-methyltransferase 1